MAARRTPTTTYRIQLNAQFTFANARALVPYLSRLGVTDLYLSPIMTARRGSTHGYDVADPTRISDELGGEREFLRLSAALQAHEMGLLLDIVPNHTAASLENPWWRDVLQNGPVSPYAPYFDISWQAARPGLANRVLLPILGAHYGDALERGELGLVYEEGRLAVSYYDWRLPVSARSYGRVFGAALPDCVATAGADGATRASLARAVGDLQRLAIGTTEQFQVAADALWQLYRDDGEVRRCVDDAIQAYAGRPGDATSFDPLDQLLGEQMYRLAYWRVASPEINYRRFFDVSDLVAMRVEDERVFAATHAAVLRLVEAGHISGLRIDHIDGLADPLAYLARLQASVDEPAELPSQSVPPSLELAESAGKSGHYVVVEKILTGDEQLPPQWPVAGTTGYEFARAVTQLLVDPEADATLDKIWTRCTGQPADFHALAIEQKLKVIAELFSGDVSALATGLAQLAGHDRHARDLTLVELERALVEATAQFPVYRTYTRDSSVASRDRAYVEEAIAAARARQPDNSAALDFLRRVLLLEMPTYLSTADRQAWLRFTMRWQQFTGPIAAKGVEDTALYIYTRFLALNEVGSEPAARANPADVEAASEGGEPVAAFHDWNAERQATWPHTLNATSTHDTKRSEDVRARLAVLSELPAAWAGRLQRWQQCNGPFQPMLEGHPVPDGSAELLIYQTLLGAWPLVDYQLSQFADRVRDYLVKAAREAKQHTSWLHPSQEYERALTSFAETLITADAGSAFATDFREFQRCVAFFGAINALSQVLLKVTAPGVPDFYQGTELWDFSLVDPDNRRPVAFDRHAELLTALDARAAADRHDLLPDLLEHWQDGRVKLFVTAQALRARRDHADLFLDGAYEPLAVAGALKRHVCAYARRRGHDWALVVAPRLSARLAATAVSPTGGTAHAGEQREADRLSPLEWPIGMNIWGDTALALPAGAPERWRDVFSGAELSAAGLTAGAALAPTLPVGATLRDFPVALLLPASA